MLVDLTFKEVRALSILGIESAKEAERSYLEAESFLRSKFEWLGRISRIISKGYDEEGDKSVYRYMIIAQGLIPEIANHKDAKIHLWSKFEHSINNLNGIGTRMEFLVEYQDDEKIINKYYDKYTSDIESYIEYIWNDFKLVFEED